MGPTFLFAAAADAYHGRARKSMKEKEIRERIERFLQRTARNVVVPASVGLSLAGCNEHPLVRGPADGGADAIAAVGEADTADLPPVAPPYLAIMPRDAPPDLTWNDDLPAVAPPYLLMFAPDAAQDLAPADSESEAGKPADAAAAVKDAGPDLLPDVTSPREVGLDLPAPPPPYLAPPPPAYLIPALATAPAGGTAPMPLGSLPKKND
jgi:hypothetical protein